MATPFLSEPECRRDDFRGGLALTLADGQIWYVPRPEVYDRLVQTNMAGGASIVFPDWCVGGRSDDAIAAEFKAYVASDGYGEGGIVATLLRRNYDVDQADAEALAFCGSGVGEEAVDVQAFEAMNAAVAAMIFEVNAGLNRYTARANERTEAVQREIRRLKGQ